LHEELHSDTEWEIPTVHPNIVRLTDQHNGFQSTAFVAQLEQLIYSNFNQQSEAATQVFALAGVHTDEFMWQESAVRLAGG
jgi:hypothetical protein